MAANFSRRRFKQDALTATTLLPIDQVAIGFSAKKIPGTVYTKMGAASGARVPPRDHLVQTILPRVSAR